MSEAIAPLLIEINDVIYLEHLAQIVQRGKWPHEFMTSVKLELLELAKRLRQDLRVPGSSTFSREEAKLLQSMGAALTSVGSLGASRDNATYDEQEQSLQQLAYGQRLVRISNAIDVRLAQDAA